jgi:UDP-glucose 4-epimerase
MVKLKKDSVVTITGGTGSFGQTMAKSLLSENVREIRIFSRDETKQELMRNSMRDERLRFFIGDVRDPDSVSSAIRGSNYVFHAAALKQVPSCEFFPMQAVATNVTGSSNVIEASVRNNVESVVCLSTDKAVYPINAMGMSKAMMEKVAQSFARSQENSGTRISITRYGNVMMSRGSVIPLFVDQIKKGLPLTITDPLMTRFMMTLDEAVDLVLFAFQNSEQGDIFVQKSPASTIGDLADAIKDIFNAPNEIKVIGTRHGEKLYESLLSREEKSKSIDLGNYFKIPADTRDLNYSKYFEEGNEKISNSEEYNSHNTQRLSKDQLKTLLLSLEYVQNKLIKG